VPVAGVAVLLAAALVAALPVAALRAAVAPVPQALAATFHWTTPSRRAAPEREPGVEVAAWEAAA
jgi:hypothetical protein